MTSEPAESDQAILDQALVAFADTAAESPDGLSNHGPMAVEALFTLGRADAIPGFTLAYLPELQRSPIVPVMGSGDPEALIGHPDAFPELRGVIARDLAIGCASEGSYEPPVRAWVARLASDPFAAAGHGLIRTFHAWRSAFRCASDAAIDELATALTYWAATWKPIVLDPPDMQSWLRTLTDLRLTLAERLEIGPDGRPQREDEETPFLRDVYEWFGMVQESLVYAIDV